ncbi:DNA polymerase III subunit gamma/tau, partial [Chromobacterium phragmitis]
MSYQVLARKWRPKRFADLVGQEHVVRALSNALKEQRLHHAYLLTGTRGVGKTTIARILAKSLNCETGTTAEPCGECQACRQIDSGRFVDLLEIDAASNTGIDNIREVLENAQYAPTMGRFKVYIIDEVHMLSKSAFNAMLKTLEEPPGHVKFILATTDPQKVPVTVLSRCLQFSLRNMTPQQVSSHLAHMLDIEGIHYEAPALALLGRAASGSMRDAQSLLDQAIAYGLGEVKEDGVRAMLGAVDRRYLFTLLQALAAADGPALMAEADGLAERGVSFDAALSELAVLLQQLALAQTVPTALAADEPERDTLLALADAIAPQDVQLYYQIAIHGRKDLALAPDEHAGFNMALLRMLAFHPAVAPTESAAPARPAALAQPRPAAAAAALAASASAPVERGLSPAARALQAAGLGSQPQGKPRAAEPAPAAEPEPEPAPRPQRVAAESTPLAQPKPEIQP